MMVARDVIEHPAWPMPWPAMELGKRSSIAYRMALVADGTYDAMMALSSKHEWDTAAGTLIVRGSGRRRQRAHRARSSPTINRCRHIAASCARGPRCTRRSWRGRGTSSCLDVAATSLGHHAVGLQVFASDPWPSSCCIWCSAAS